MFFFLGSDAGSSFYGILFHAMGTRYTLIICGSISGLMFAALLIYLRISEHAHQYEKLPSDNEDDHGTAVNGDNIYNSKENYEADK